MGILLNQIKMLFMFSFFRLSREVVGRLSLALLKFNLTLKENSPITSKHISILQKRGVVVIEDFIDAQRCIELTEEIDHCFELQSPRLQHTDDIRMFDAQTTVSGILPFYSNKLLRKIGCAYLGTPITNSSCLINLVPANQSTFGSGGSWHRDAIFPQFKSMVYLSDVCDDNDGAFTYIPKSNRLSYFLREIFRQRRSPLNTRWSELEIYANPHNQPISIIGKAGTLVLFDTCLLHRGNPNKNSTDRIRYAATNYYRSILGNYKSY